MMPQKSETLDQMLRRLVVDDGLSPEIAADKAMHSVPKTQLIDYMRPIIITQAKKHARREVREIENRALAPAVVSERPTTAEARTALVSRGFAVPGKGLVDWADATTEDHLARAQWQRNSAAASITDAERHEAAAALIEQHGATCLGEIDGWPGLLGEAA